MIREHGFNTRWWGSSVGIVDDAAFFALPPAEQLRLLDTYAWTEYRGPLPAPPGVEAAGFRFVDLQLRFRIGLRQVPEVQAFAARAGPLALDPAQLADFQHERFAQIPSATATAPRLAQRYAAWCRELSLRSPETALQIEGSGGVLGWFVAEPTKAGLHLALAMLHREAHASGQLLYQRALREYAAQGHKVGYASFSATNTAVHNIYAALGARFLAPEACFIRVSPRR